MPESPRVLHFSDFECQYFEIVFILEHIKHILVKILRLVASIILANLWMANSLFSWILYRNSLTWQHEPRSCRQAFHALQRSQHERSRLGERAGEDGDLVDAHNIELDYMICNYVHIRYTHMVTYVWCIIRTRIIHDNYDIIRILYNTSQCIYYTDLPLEDLFFLSSTHWMIHRSVHPSHGGGIRGFQVISGTVRKPHLNWSWIGRLAIFEISWGESPQFLLYTNPKGGYRWL